MNVAEIISSIKDIVLTLAGGVTAVVAIRGLRAWRVELRGRADFEAARALARATFKLRDEIQSCRSPFIRGSEFPAGYDDAGGPKMKAQGTAHVFRTRWARILPAIQEFDGAVLEAEALWGSDVRAPALEFRRCVLTLQVAMDSIIENDLAGGEHFARDREFGVRTRSQAYASADAKDNELSRDINSAVEGIESILRAKVAHSR